MSEKGRQPTHRSMFMASNTKNKKNKVLETEKKSTPLKVIIPLAIVAVVTVIMVIVITQRNDSGRTALSSGDVFAGSARPRSQSSNRNSETLEGTKVVLNASDFADGKAKYYSVDISGKSVRFFVLKSSDGVIRSAFDACDVCYRAKKGYRQSGDLMICNNCGQQFPSVRINIEKGGCNPSPLDRTFDGDSIIITRADIEKGLMYF